MDFKTYQERARATAIYGASIRKMLQPIHDLVERDLAKQETDATTPDLDFSASDALNQVEYMLNVGYAVLGLVGEAGEIANKFKKEIRDGNPMDDANKELGDVQWYVANLTAELYDSHYTLADVAQANLEKLQSREERGVLQGSGDNR